MCLTKFSQDSKTQVLSDFLCCFAGTVIEKNEAVESGPSLINTSSMDEGWLFKVKLAKPEEIEELMNQEAYDKYLKEHEEE